MLLNHLHAQQSQDCRCPAGLQRRKTVQRTVDEIPRDIVDEIILTDDASWDNTAALAQKLGLYVVRHDKNRGYGGNQKTCYEAALARGADIIVMLLTISTHRCWSRLWPR